MPQAVQDIEAAIKIYKQIRDIKLQNDQEGRDEIKRRDQADRFEQSRDSQVSNQQGGIGLDGNPTPVNSMTIAGTFIYWAQTNKPNTISPGV